MMFSLIFLFFIVVLILGRLWSLLGQSRGVMPQKSNKTVFLKKDQVQIEREVVKPNSFYPGFEESAFLNEAELLFHKILSGYYRGDFTGVKKNIAPRLLKSVFHTTPQEALKDLCVTHVAILEKSIKDKTAEIEVEVTSQQVFESELVTRKDHWLFKRKIEKPDAPWILSEVKSRETS